MKTSVKFPFSSLSVLESNIVELSVTTPMQIDVTMIDELQRLLSQSVSDPFTLFVVAQDEWDLDLGATITLNQINDLEAIAFICPCDHDLEFPFELMNISRALNIEGPTLGIFSSVSDARAWVQNGCPWSSLPAKKDYVDIARLM